MKLSSICCLAINLEREKKANQKINEYLTDFEK